MVRLDCTTSSFLYLHVFILSLLRVNARILTLIH
jgi:hypothetical protein